MKKLIIAITSAFMLFATSAMSMDLRPTVGISGNVGVYAATGIENNFNEAGSAIDETTKEYGAFAPDIASVFVELDLNDALSIGVDYVPTTIDTPQNTSNDGANENVVKAEFENLTTIYAKVNIPLGGLYAKVGYSMVDVNSIETMNSGNSYGNDNTSGLTVGLGYAHEVAAGVSIRAEITGSDFEDVQTDNGVASTGNRNVIVVEDMIGARGTISVVK